MNQLIKFHFKGTRTYVQGGDFYDKVSELLGDDEFINDIKRVNRWPTRTTPNVPFVPHWT